MAKRIRNTSIQKNVSVWSNEVGVVARMMQKHPNRLKTFKMADYKTYLIFCHCFGLDDHEDCKGSQERTVEHLSKEHGLVATGDVVHTAKHTGICWMTNNGRGRKTNRVKRMFGAVIGNWESRVGKKPGDGVKFLAKHQRFRQILSEAIKRRPDFLDRLKTYEKVYQEKNGQKLWLSKIAEGFVRGQEISQIVFELKNSGIEIVEKDADLFLEIAVVFSGGEIQSSDVSDLSREIVSIIKDERRTFMAEEFTKTPEQTEITLFGYDIWRGLYDHLLGIAVNTPLVSDKIADFGSNGQIIFTPGKIGYLPIVVEVIKQIYPNVNLDMSQKEDKYWVRDTVVDYLALKKVMFLEIDERDSKLLKQPPRYVILDPSRFDVIKKSDSTRIKRRLNLNQGGEPMNNLDFIRQELKKSINEDANFLNVFLKKIEMWKEDGGEDLLLAEVLNKFLADQEVSRIEFDLSMPNGSGIEKLELALRLLGSDVQLQAQPSEWVMTTLVAIEGAYKAQTEIGDGKKMEQEESLFSGVLGTAIPQDESIKRPEKKTTKRMPEYYHRLWEHLFDLALEKRMNSRDVDANRAVWTSSYFEAVKQWTIDNYPSTKDSKPYQFRDRWQSLEDQGVITTVPVGEKETGARSYYILDPNQFNFKPTPATDTLRRWLGLKKVRADKVVEPHKLIKAMPIPDAEPATPKVEKVKIVGLKDAVIAENQKRIESLSQEIVNLDVVIQETKDKLSAMEADRALFSDLLVLTKDQMKRLGVDVTE